MAGIHYSSKTNSQLFTDCCCVAICDDQDNCPKCGKQISASPRERHDMAMRAIYALYGSEDKGVANCLRKKWGTPSEDCRLKACNLTPLINLGEEFL